MIIKSQAAHLTKQYFGKICSHSDKNKSHQSLRVYTPAIQGPKFLIGWSKWAGRRGETEASVIVDPVGTDIVDEVVIDHMQTILCYSDKKFDEIFGAKLRIVNYC